MMRNDDYDGIMIGYSDTPFKILPSVSESFQERIIHLCCGWCCCPNLVPSCLAAWRRQKHFTCPVAPTLLLIATSAYHLSKGWTNGWCQYNIMMLVPVVTLLLLTFWTNWLLLLRLPLHLLLLFLLPLLPPLLLRPLDQPSRRRHPLQQLPPGLHHPVNLNSKHENDRMTKTQPPLAPPAPSTPPWRWSRTSAGRPARPPLQQLALALPGW